MIGTGEGTPPKSQPAQPEKKAASKKAAGLATAFTPLDTKGFVRMIESKGGQVF